MKPHNQTPTLPDKVLAEIIRPKGKVNWHEDLVTQKDLAKRWKISEATLERDRSLGKGCRYIKIGHLVRYRLVDVEAYENECTVETGK